MFIKIFNHSEVLVTRAAPMYLREVFILMRYTHGSACFATYFGSCVYCCVWAQAVLVLGLEGAGGERPSLAFNIHWRVLPSDDEYNSLVRLFHDGKIEACSGQGSKP